MKYAFEMNSLYYLTMDFKRIVNKINNFRLYLTAPELAWDLQDRPSSKW